MKDGRNPAVQALLRMTATAYGGALRLRNGYYDRPGAAWRAGLPVISVGNITVGGTGKTPIVAWLANHLRAIGRRPAVISRGYRGKAGRGPLIVSDGHGPRCSARECGDEAYLLARRLAETIVVVGADRCADARAALELGADVAILDDGFQHRRLARDLDIVLLDASNPFGGYDLLPAGLLREPVRGLGRADVIVITRTRPGERLVVIERAVRHHNVQAPLLRAGHEPVGFFDVEGQAVESPPRCVVFCGIGNPNRFRIDLEALGVEIVAFRPQRDHHWFRRAELQQLRELATSHRAALVTTEKDLVRLDPPELSETTCPLYVLRIEAVIHESDPLLEAVRRALGETTR